MTTLLRDLVPQYPGESPEWGEWYIVDTIMTWCCYKLTYMNMERTMDDSQLPVKTEPHLQTVAKWLPQELADHFAVETTLPQVTDQDRRTILNIIEGDALKGESLIGSELYLGDYIIHPITLEDTETGEMVDAARTLLVQPSGPPVAFASVGVLKSIARIAWSVQHPPPFDPPIKVRLVQKPAGKGKRVYKLIPVTET